MVGVAVKVTLVPAQTLLVEGVMVIDGVSIGLTTIVILLLVAVADVTQVALLVKMQETILPLLKVADEKVELLAPACIPFTNH